MNLKGLTDQQVKESRKKYGTNSLTEKERESFLDKLKDNLGDPMIKILIFALIISSIFAFLGKADWIETLGILFAISATTYISTWSEYRNENTFAKLQEEASKILVKVIRNGVLTEVKIDDLVVGDIIKLQNGDKIPADGIMREGEISVDQSSLNGESKECHKYATEDEFILSTPVNFLHKNNVYRGSTVTNGSGYMEVTVVGDKSVYGQIASELQLNEERDSPLKVKLSDLANKISKFGHCGGILISIAYLFKKIIVNNQFNLSAILYYCGDYIRLFNDILQAVMFAVIIIVMAVPEGLPLMIAIVSSQNMSKMLKDNVLVKTITGIETAGSLNIIFSDKTGTITKGKLEVVDFIIGDLKSFKSFKDLAYNKLRHLLFLNINHNTDAQWNGECIGGNMTEKALMNFIEHYESDNTRIKMNPFNSKDKYSSCLLKKDNHNIVMFKGAPEKILEHCENYVDEYGNKFKINKEKLYEKIDELANKSIRVLALAYKEDSQELNLEKYNDLSLIGLVAIKDDVRPEAIEAIKECNSAGIQVVMVTGDKKETAIAIAKEANLITEEKHIALTSDEMAKLSDEELKKLIPNLRVVARALPSDKSRLVKVAQELNLVIGMTGDGTNDAPALKRADVGFAMGKSGTEVAKEAGDIVILDDNFKSIANAVLYGRTIFNSIRKFIIFQLSINISAVGISFLAPLLNIAEPLSITQILWVNLIMDTLAALAFGGEPALHRYMQEKPKRRDENIINKYMLSSILTTSIFTIIVSLIFFLTNYFNKVFTTPEELRTGYFTLFVFIAMLNGFNARTEKLNIFDNISKNSGFIKIMSLVLIVQVLMTQFGGKIMHCYGLTLEQWLHIIVISLLVIPVGILKKILVK